MKLYTELELVKNWPDVMFERIEDRKLWYQCVALDAFGGYAESGFEFPVPFEETDGGLFLPRDKTMAFRRWIGRHLKFIKEAVVEAELAKNDLA